MVKPMVPELMVQQQIDGAWQHMVGVMMLNRARGVVVKKVLRVSQAVAHTREVSPIPIRYGPEDPTSSGILPSSGGSHP